MDLLSDRPLNLERDQSRIHADMHCARDTGKDRAAYLDEVAHPGEVALHSKRPNRS